jgi:hypothetical protein
MASLTTPTSTTATGAPQQQQNADEAISEAPAGEDDLGEDESAFDEEGLLFGDSELIITLRYCTLPYITFITLHYSTLLYVFVRFLRIILSYIS